jgi:hypothetical protein
VTVRTEFPSVEENDGEIRKAIERRAYVLYERDGSKDGSDQQHWEVTCSIENDEVTVRLPLERVSASTVLVSISARSALIFSLDDESHPGGIESDFLRVVSLPVEVDATRATCELDEGDLVLTLPVTDVPVSARTACA